jgi:hypothetical protein
VAIKATPAGVYICPSLVAICSEGEKEGFRDGPNYVRIGKDRGHPLPTPYLTYRYIHALKQDAI